MKTTPSAEAATPRKATRHFVANRDDTFTCEDCLPDPSLLGEQGCEVWEELSSGWTAPCVCATCHLSIPVYVDGGTSR